MFTLLAKLVRKLSKSERSSLADKLVNLAKQEQSDDSQPSGGESKYSKALIVNANAFFTSNSAGYSYLSDLMQAAMERGSFCGLIVKDTNGMKKTIFAQNDFSLSNGAYSLLLYVQGFGSSTPTISTFQISQIPESYIMEFRRKEAECIFTANS